MSWQNPSWTQTQTPSSSSRNIHTAHAASRKSLILSATFGKVISQSDVEAEAVKSINPVYLPLTDANTGHISRLTSKRYQGQELKRPVRARCIQKHVTGRSGACRHR